jgi:hypothetical protein
MDFAKNRGITYQNEIKSVFYSQEQVTMHPVVTYYKSGNSLVRDSSIVISDDHVHDFHAVHHFGRIVDDHIAEKCGTSPEKKVIFSDGCSAKYKSKGPFADLSLDAAHIDRNYFGSEHGKGDCDAEIGHINKLLDRAIIGTRSPSTVLQTCSNIVPLTSKLTNFVLSAILFLFPRKTSPKIDQKLESKL